MTLAEVKKVISNRHGYDNWETLVKEIANDWELIDFYTDIVAIEYCTQFISDMKKQNHEAIKKR